MQWEGTIRGMPPCEDRQGSLGVWPVGRAGLLQPGARPQAPQAVGLSGAGTTYLPGLPCCASLLVVFASAFLLHVPFC